MSYSLVRLGLFTAVFLLLWLLGIEWWAAGLFATVISFTVGYIFFHSLREQIARDLEERAKRRAEKSRDIDSEVEDEALENDGGREAR